MVLFADDINILTVDKNIDPVQARLNWVINSLKLGSQVTNSLIISTDKTEVMLFHLNKTCNLVMPKIVLKMLKSHIYS